MSAHFFDRFLEFSVAYFDFGFNEEIQESLSIV